MPQFMDFHPNLPLPKDAIEGLREGAQARTQDEFGVTQLELYHNEGGQVYCLLDAPNEEAVRKHHEALGVDCGDVHQVESLL